MTELIINYLKTSASKHVLGLIVTGAVLLAGTSWLREHDARILAEQTVKQSQDRVAVLEKQSQDVARAGNVQIAKLQKQAVTVKTPAQAIQAIPELTDVPLNARPLPDAPSAVEVEAVPLFQELNKCKQCEVDKGVLSAELDIEHKIEVEKDQQITTLKKKPGLWKRVESTAITVGIGAAIGYAAHK